MGRRGRTHNCSPIDSVLERYHNEIGNRLSGVFLPTHPTPDQPMADQFSMLTLDTRHRSSTKLNNATGKCHSGKTHNMLKNQIVNDTAQTDEEAAQEDAPSSSSSSTVGSIRSSMRNEHSSMSKDKKGLMDKLSRALFQRKHSCSRCRRRSRSCMPNKTFFGTEKHYTCGRCRESSHAIKNLFSGHSNSSQNGSEMSVHSSSGLVSEGKHKENSVIPQPRSHQDSGYETVTSCSTVASSYSAFTTPATQRYADQSGKDVSANNRTPPKETQDPGTDFAYSAPKTFTTAVSTVAPLQAANSQKAGLHHFMGVGQQGGVLKQVRTKHVDNYDGYLPDATGETHDCDVIEVRIPLTDTTNKKNNSDVESQKQIEVVPSRPACYTCGATNKPNFRLPWAGGWLCEDCLDGVH